MAGALFGKTRRSILSLIYGNTDRSYYTREIARETGISVGTIQRELENLAGAGIIEKKAEGRHVYYRAAPSCPIFDELRSLVRKTGGLADTIRSALEPAKEKIRLAFIYGSTAQMEERAGSDVDLMIIGDISFGDVVDMTAGLQNSIGREINPTVYPAKEFRKKTKSGNNFLKRVIKGPKLFLVGDEDDLKKLAK